MPSIGKFCVWIEVDGKRLGEYSARLIDKKEASSSSTVPTVVCHVPSQPGKHFVLCFSHSCPDVAGNVRAVAKVHIDNVQTNHLILENDGVTHCEGTLVNPTQQRNFQFAALSSSPSRLNSPHVLPSLLRSSNTNTGTIHLDFRLAIVEKLNGFQPFEVSNAFRGKKRTSKQHQTAFAPEVTAATAHAPVSISPLKRPSPLCVKYIYAPKEFWQSQNIMPRELTVPSSPSNYNPWTNSTQHLIASNRSISNRSTSSFNFPSSQSPPPSSRLGNFLDMSDADDTSERPISPLLLPHPSSGFPVKNKSVWNDSGSMTGSLRKLWNK